MEGGAQRVLTCEWLYCDVVNYAMQQNHIPVVRKLLVTNTSLSDLHQITIRIVAEPDFSTGWMQRLDIIPAGQTIDLGVINLQLSGAFLASLTERITGILLLQVIHNDQIIFSESSPISVLAYDQWGGLANMPEMVVAFVMPNHPMVTKVISEAAPILDKWTGSPSFDAYQSRNPNRIRMQAAAIYTAIQARDIVYSVAPASFEEVGQRVRLPDAMLTNKIGNCLDLTLLYTACLEAVGLHPLIIFTEGHAFAGVWLIEETFSESVQDDITLLTKRLADGVHEISLAEATLMVAGQTASYQEAEVLARANVMKSNDFYGFIDVKRARASALRPIPMRISTASGWEIMQESKEVNREASAVAPVDMTIQDRPKEVTAIAVTKQRIWERRLLDLSMRNTLLNFRMTRSAIPLMNADLGEIEDALAEGQEFQILPRPVDWEQTTREANLFHNISKEHPLTQLIKQEFLQKRLRANVNERDLLVKATHLYRSARLSLEENGANTLYMALGLLKWYESGASELPRYAPIILVPVELLRKSSKSGFVLRIRDEDPHINITLLEMLRQDFGSHIGGLDPLPRDETGIDVASIFTTIRHVIMQIPKWDIIESAFLGLFSFSRFVMWNDIRSRASDLVKNKVVASLMSGRLEWDASQFDKDFTQQDDEHSLSELMLPISSDSSQLTAIRAAHGNQSFVLHGPPGTGKSQTITNLIASVLAEGKTVLFVAEKMAALSVVQYRLEQIGLGPFCLELHSYKSTKKAVLEQLRKTLETFRASSSDDWERQADRLKGMRNELNEYVTSLHQRHSFGFSLYEAIVRYGNVRAFPEVVVFDPAVTGIMSREQVTVWSDLANELRVVGQDCGSPFQNAWEDSACSSYTPSLKSQVANVLTDYIERLCDTRKTFAAMSQLLPHLSAQPTSSELELVMELAALIQKIPTEVPLPLLAVEDLDAALHSVHSATEHGHLRNEGREQILTHFTPEALSFDAELTLSEWRMADLRWYLPRVLKQSRIVRIIKRMAISGKTISPSTVPAHLLLIIGYQAEKAALHQVEAVVAPLLDTLWNSGEADWLKVVQATDWIQKLNRLLHQLYIDSATVFSVRKQLATLLNAGSSAFLKKYDLSLQQFMKAKLECERLEQQIGSVLVIDFKKMDENQGAQAWLDYREGKARRWVSNLDSLREWCGWRRVREQVMAAGMSSLVEAYEQGRLQHDEVVPSYEQAWFKSVIEYVLSGNEQLSAFSGKRFDEKIKGFQEMTERFEALTKQEIEARLAAKIPQMQSQAASSSEAGILLRAIRSGGRNLSLRKLFELIPNLMNRICPCVLMSPMSVAQYLDPKYELFDLVVFDEASQLPTSEAVGAMARGRNVIVVGDPKQLPPTSFFANTATDDSDDHVVPDDLESILDDCLALGMPQEHLLWHYRSRHESLIAFSNRHFYDNKLLTFPSPYERMSNVRWHPVDGYYDRGKSKQNRAEAEAVVAEIVRRLNDPEEAKRTIGVVTFNSIQQGLIEDLLDETFRKNTDLELIAAQASEPIFIKNLENVQGDERDVILFSIGYGPDETGKVSLNFGPLNREGGWRRLNVAVSRARHEMHIFSTLRAEHLDVSRTSAQGVSALKSFLEYAEKGPSALNLQVNQLKQGATQTMGLEGQIAEALCKLGYQLELHVGTSGFRVDVAIVNPDLADNYLLAILCDGDGYKSGKTARDREVLRTQVLSQLGWHIHRVWSPDWLENPEREINKVREAIKEAQEAVKAVKAVEGSRTQVSQEVIKVMPSYELAVKPIVSSAQARYIPCIVPTVNLSAEEFYNSAHTGVIREQIEQVIEAEGPISRSLLLRRVLLAWGMTRIGARIDRQFETICANMNLKKTTCNGYEFMWPREMEPSEYGLFRIAEQEQDRRNAEDLPPEEVACAINEILFNQIGLPQEDLIRETVKLLGYARTGTSLEKAVNNGIKEAVHRGFAVIRQGSVYLNE